VRDCSRVVNSERLAMRRTQVTLMLMLRLLSGYLVRTFACTRLTTAYMYIN